LLGGWIFPTLTIENITCVSEGICFSCVLNQLIVTKNRQACPHFQPAKNDLNLPSLIGFGNIDKVVEARLDRQN
jgi:hypothetical protein